MLEKAPEKEKHGRNRHLVLMAPLEAERPRSAYELLRVLPDAGLRSPLQVYRALERLAAADTVHKIEGVCAYAPCPHADCGHAGPAVFAVCRRCGQATETRDPSINRLPTRLARSQQFRTQATTIELSASCAA